MYNQKDLKIIVDALANARSVTDARSILWDAHKQLFYNSTPTPDNPAYFVYSANTWGDGGRTIADNLTRLGATIAHRRCASQGGDAITATIHCKKNGGKVPHLSLDEDVIKDAIFWTRFMVHFDDADYPQWYRDRVAREGGRQEYDEVLAVGWPAFFMKICENAKKRVRRLLQYQS